MTAAESAPMLSVEGVTKHFPVRSGFRRGARAIRAVDGVDLTVRRGEIVSLVGESGSGKSTLGRCITGMTAPTSGRIVFDGQDLAGLGRSARSDFRRRVQPVFQDPRSSLDPRWPISRTISEPLDANHIGTKASRTERVRELADLVGLSTHLLDRTPGQLSGGQQQRVAIAAALALEPELIVADEPVSALDVSVQAQILNLFVRLREELGVGLLFIAHDLSVVEHLSDRVAVMYLGRLVEFGTTSDVFDRPAHPYTRALMEAIPRPDPRQRSQRVRLTGEIPSPINPPSGCHFHTRCPLAVSACSIDMPPLVAYSATQTAACWVTSGAVEPRAPGGSPRSAALPTDPEPGDPPTGDPPTATTATSEGTIHDRIR